MSSMTIILGMMAVFYACVIYVLYRTMQTDKPSFDEYAVGGRRYGAVFIGMSYVQSFWPGVIFTGFLGGIGVRFGVMIFYALTYSVLGLVMMYFMANRAWRWGQRYDLRSQPDLLQLRFNSPWVKIVASCIGLVAIMPWVILGIQSLSVLFQVASNFKWSITASLVAGILIILVRQYWTVRMGMRGLIMTDMLQGSVAYIGGAAIAIIMLAAGNSSPAPYKNLAHLPAALLHVPGDGGSYGPFYMFALIVMGVIGAMCWPMSFQRIYTAKGVRSVKKGTLWALTLMTFFLAVICVFALAVAVVPGLKDNPQFAWFNVLHMFGGPWLVGLGCVMILAASMGHVDGSVQVCGTQIANDLVNHWHPLKDRQLTVTAKVAMVAYMLIASVLSYVLFDVPRLQLLAQMSYYWIIQLAVPLYFGLFSRFGNKQGVLAGMLSGSVVATLLTLKWDDAIPALGGLTSGLVGLAVNLVVFVVVTLVTGQSAEEKARVKKLFDQTSRKTVRTARQPAPVTAAVSVAASSSDSTAAANSRRGQ
jgi:Na+/proline symporter